MTQDHARWLRPSGSVIWYPCPPSERIQREFPDTTNPAAAFGTVAHYVAEMALAQDVNPVNWLHQKIDVPGKDFEEEVYVTEEMVEMIDEYVDYCRALPGRKYIEERVDLSAIIPEGFGTLDYAAVQDGQCTVVDFKTGRGVKVDAYHHWPMVIYAIGMYHHLNWLYSFKKFKLVIVQPPFDHISEWEMDVEELLAWGRSIQKAGESALKGGAKFNPGEKQCRFCKARAVCKARAMYSLEQVLTAAKEAEGDKLEPEVIAAVLRQERAMISFLKSVKKHATELLLDGVDVPGFKPVRKDTKRKLEDVESLAIKLMEQGYAKNEIYKTEVRSLTELEKTVGKDNEILQEHIFKPLGDPDVAPENDKRESLLIETVDLSGFDED